MHSGLYIRLWLPHLYILHIVLASMSTPVCVAFTLRFSGPSLALFSRWQRVHGYTSLIRQRLHSSLHSTSTFSEHFRDSSILHHKHFRKLLRVLNTAICCGWTFSRTFIDFLALTPNPAYIFWFRLFGPYSWFSQTFVGLQQCNVLWVNIFENILIQAIPFANIRRFSGPCP